MQVIAGRLSHHSSVPPIGYFFAYLLKAEYSSDVRVLLLTPPMTQLNTPYPATAYLMGFLKEHESSFDSGLDVTQADPALSLFLRLFSRQGLARIAFELESLAVDFGTDQMPESVANFLQNKDAYLGTVEPVIDFLQGKNPTLANRIISRNFLPEGPRFVSTYSEENPLGWAFGELGTTDMAKYLASLYIDDLSDVIKEGIDERFQLSRYAESLAASSPSFDPLQEALAEAPSLVDELLDEIAEELLTLHCPDVIGLSVPFPGNVYGAFRIAKKARERTRDVKVVMGGGFVNTELREISDPRVFEYVDYITLDDGELPFLTLLKHLERGDGQLKRTFRLKNGVVVYEDNPNVNDIPANKTGIPTYDGLQLDNYVSLFEMLNPMHRLWSDGRWNKLTIAHGCYWKKCTFCDVSLDYIKRYDPTDTIALVDRIERMIDETGQTGFHFVDEAAPPSKLRAMAERLIERKVPISWWGNVRFEKAFTPELAQLLADSGCVAISGGLEVASERLLKLMKKGVSIEQVAKVTRGFANAGVMVHAYLMYGFPTQTTQETVDSLEWVRQLFENECIHSAFWHRFAATVHSPIGIAPQDYGIQIGKGPEVRFAKNDLAFYDPTGTDHDSLGDGLKKALYNFMHGVGLDLDVRSWFDDNSLSPTIVSPHYIRSILT